MDLLPYRFGKNRFEGKQVFLIVIKKQIDRIRSSEFALNVLKLVSGTSIAQALSLLISPLLSRIYTPDENGLLTFITTVSSVLTLISTGRYDIALMLPKRQTSAANLFWLSTFICSGFTLLMFLVMFILQLTGNAGNFREWVYVVPLLVFFLGMSQIMSAWMVRSKRYSQIVVYRISQSAANNGGALGFSFFRNIVNGMVLGYFLSAVTGATVLLKGMYADWKKLKRSFSLKAIKALAIEYKQFPLINTFQTFMDGMQINGMIILVTFLFGEYETGIIGLSIRILFVPMNFIGSSISQVFYQEASEKFRQHQPLIPLASQTIKRTSLLIAPVLLIIIITGPWVFSFVYGKNWEASGHLARYLALWICLDFIRAPLSQIPLIINRQQTLLVLSVLSNTILFSLIIGGKMLGYPFEWIIALISLTQSTYIILLIIWILRVTSKVSREHLRE